MEKTVLVIYYSDTGNTEKVARHIANETGAVVEAIHTPVFGKGIWNFVTLGGSGGESALQDMKDLSDLEPEVELIINQKDFRADDASIKTRRYASYLINR